MDRRYGISNIKQLQKAAITIQDIGFRGAWKEVAADKTCLLAFHFVRFLMTLQQEMPWRIVEEDRYIALQVPAQGFANIAESMRKEIAAIQRALDKTSTLSKAHRQKPREEQEGLISKRRNRLFEVIYQRIIQTCGPELAL